MSCIIFNFYLSSAEKDSGTNNNANYFIDWSANLPRGRYKCTYTFNTCNTNIYLGINGDKLFPALLHINMGCSSNFYYLDNKITNSNIVGFLKWNSYLDVLGNGYLYSDNNNNSPFFFNNGLFNNFINIRITEFDGSTLWTDSNNDTPNDYILCLTFELME